MKEKASENIVKSQTKQQEAYLKRIQKKYKNITFNVGDKVLLFNARKKGRKGGRLQPDFSGPYTICNVTGKAVVLKNQEGHILKTTYNINHLKPYKEGQENGDTKEAAEQQQSVTGQRKLDVDQGILEEKISKLEREQSHTMKEHIVNLEVEQVRLEEKCREFEGEQSQTVKEHIKLEVEHVLEEKLELQGGQALKKEERLPQTGRERGKEKTTRQQKVGKERHDNKNTITSDRKKERGKKSSIQTRNSEAVAKNPEERGIVKMYCSTRKSNSRAGTYPFGSFL